MKQYKIEIELQTDESYKIIRQAVETFIKLLNFPVDSKVIYINVILEHDGTKH